ncbi:hypothetical protein GCM10010286_53990 [Streptomyces toxytricini]|nr:hypothetical protein GCM10010286_53990 [Streptomyces toxytricini]
MAVPGRGWLLARQGLLADRVESGGADQRLFLDPPAAHFAGSESTSTELLKHSPTWHSTSGPRRFPPTTWSSVSSAVARREATHACQWACLGGPSAQARG